MFEKRLAKLREQKKLTHQDMADKLGITRQAYGNYEAGKREPDYKTLIWLSDFFDVQTDYLLGKTDEKRPTDHIAADTPLLKRYSDLLRNATQLGVSISFYGGPSEDITEEMIEGWEEELAEFEAFRAEQRQKKKK